MTSKKPIKKKASPAKKAAASTEPAKKKAVAKKAAPRKRPAPKSVVVTKSAKKESTPAEISVEITATIPEGIKEVIDNAANVVKANDIMSPSLRARVLKWFTRK